MCYYSREVSSFSYCGSYEQGSTEVGPEDVSLLERCLHFRGWYVQASMELGPKECVPIGEVSSFRRYM